MESQGPPAFAMVQGQQASLYGQQQYAPQPVQQAAYAAPNEQYERQPPQPNPPNSSSSTPTRPPPVVARKPHKEETAHDLPLAVRAADEETEDGRIRNREANRLIRDDWIYHQVRERRDEFTQYHQATLFVGTWNVNAKGKEEDALDPWLCADWRSMGKSPDIVAVGFQEIVDLNAVNVAVDNKTQQRTQFWTERLQATLNRNSREGYVLLAQRSMVGLLICVFVKQQHQGRVQHVSTSSVGVGVMGMMGNKGGVSVRLQFYDSTICFVCSHLAAHRENVIGRNADFANVYSKTIFEIGVDAIRESIRSGGLSNWLVGSTIVKVPNHDIVVWLGDLNYRIDESMETEKVLRLSEKNILDDLRRLDQLNRQRAAGNAFQDFEEGVLNFPPTYKYQPGTDMYEQRPDKKLRAPAWCDRILWMAQISEHVQQLTYNRSEAPNVSDHKAVYSTMLITVKDVVREKREAIYKELTSRLDRYDNTTMPLAKLDKDSIDFGEIRYNQSITVPVKIANIGSVIAQYRFAPKPNEASVCKPWLTVTPMFGMLVPDDQAATLNFTVKIDNRTAQMLNSGREVLDDILILRIEGGRDFYISVKASYARSCFAMSAEELVMYREPIRMIPLDPIERSQKIDTNGITALCIPKELWRTVDAIYEKGLDTRNLFVDPGVPEEVDAIRECLDTGARFGQFSIHSYAEVLVSFLASMSVPVVPFALYPTADVDAQNIQLTARRVLEELSPIHYNIFVYVISFFREVLVFKDRNQLRAAKVAQVCCSCLAPGIGLDNSSASFQKRKGMELVMMHLLETSSI